MISSIKCKYKNKNRNKGKFKVHKIKNIIKILNNEKNNNKSKEKLINL